jgi:hypothetical protein
VALTPASTRPAPAGDAGSELVRQALAAADAAHALETLFAATAGSTARPAGAAADTAARFAGRVSPDEAALFADAVARSTLRVRTAAARGLAMLGRTSRALELRALFGRVSFAADRLAAAAAAVAHLHAHAAGTRESPRAHVTTPEAQELARLAGMAARLVQTGAEALDARDAAARVGAIHTELTRLTRAGARLARLARARLDRDRALAAAAPTWRAVYDDLESAIAAGAASSELLAALVGA